MSASITPILFSRLTALLALVSITLALGTAVFVASAPAHQGRYAPPMRQMRVAICVAHVCIDTGVEVAAQSGYTYGKYPWPQIQTWEK